MSISYHIQDNMLHGITIRVQQWYTTVKEMWKTMKYNFDEVIDRSGTYCSQWDFNLERFGNKDILPFSISDMDFKVPIEITEVLQTCVEHQIYGYTRWNHASFKEAITSFYQRRHGLLLDPNKVVYSPTVMYSIATLFKLLSNVGDCILTCNPMYDAFFKVVENNQRILLKSELKIVDGKYQIDFEDLDKQLSKASIFLLCSPHNPTGKMWSKQELATLVTLCKKHRVKIISDEIHSDIILTSKRYTSILSFLDQYEDIYMVSSASKTMNTPGLLGSYAYIKKEKIKEGFNQQCKDTDFVGSASLLGMQATMVGYRECDGYIEELITYIKGNMQVAKEFIDAHFTDVHFIIPEATYLAWIDIGDVPFTMEQIQEALVNVGKVGIMSGMMYGANDHLRMNLGCPRSKVIDGLQRFKKAMEYLYHKQ